MAGPIVPPIVFGTVSSPVSTLLLDQNFNYQAGTILDTLAELRATTPMSPTITPPRIFVCGTTAVGTGTGSWYWYNPADTTSPDNGGSIIVAADGGRWYQLSIFYGVQPFETAAGVTPSNLLYAPFCLERYGADYLGAIESSVAFNNAFAVGLAFGNAEVYSAYGGQYLINNPLTIYTDHVGFDGGGCQINSPNFPSSSLFLFNPVNNTSDPEARMCNNLAHPLRRFSAVGPGGSVNCGFIQFDDTTESDPLLPGITIEKGGSTNWQVHAQYLIGASFITFRDWNFGTNGFTTNSQIFVNMPGAVASGESNVFDTCRFGLTSQESISHADANGDTYFKNCRFDATQLQHLNQTNGRVYLDNPHIEVTTDAATWFNVSGAYSRLNVEGGVSVIPNAKTVYSPFHSDSSIISGRVRIVGHKLAIGAVSFTVPLISGTGPAICTDIDTYSTGTQPPLYAISLNELADPIFASGGFSADGWVAAGAAPPTVTNTNPYSGTYAAQLTGASGQTNSLTLTLACQPGQMFVGQCYLGMTNWGTGTVGLTGSVYFINAAGTVIGSGYAFTGTGIQANQAYTFYNMSGYAPAPAGTRNVKLQFVMSGITTGSPKGYVGLVNVNIQ